MRRVIDDTHFDEIATLINKALNHLPSETVSVYSWGDWRASRNKIKEYLMTNIKNIKFGKDVNTTGIGNNACYELIYTGNPVEEQICGIIHMTDNMYGSIICWVSDYDNENSTNHIQIHGINPNFVRRFA